MTNVFSITIQRRAVPTPLAEKSSTIVIKMLHQVLEDSRKASKSGAETDAKVICLCDETRHKAVAATEQTTADTVHRSVVRAADCRSAGPWFNSGRTSWFTFMTWSSNLIIQMINVMSPITTIIRKSVICMVAELRNGTALWTVGSIGQRLEDLKAKDESQLAEAHQIEAAASHNFQMLQQSLEDEMKFNAQDLEAAKHSFGEVQGQLTTDTSDLKMTEDALAEDTVALEDTTQDCQATAADFEAPTKSLSEELQALAKTRAVISEKTGGAESFSYGLTQTSFLQLFRSVMSSRGGLACSLAQSEHSIELSQLMLLPRCTPRREKQRKSEPPYKTARSGDIVMVIDGETFCVPEEDVPKVHYEEDDGQVLPTEQVHEGMQRKLQLMKDLEVSERILRTDVPSGKKIYSNGDDPFAKVKGLISDMIARGVCGRYPQGYLKCLYSASVSDKHGCQVCCTTGRMG